MSSYKLWVFLAHRDCYYACCKEEHRHEKECARGNLFVSTSSFLFVNSSLIYTMQPKRSKHKLVKGLLLVAGLICLSFGVLGIVLPILPTTPFLLAATACFCKSSDRMYSWLLNNRLFGSYIRNYKEGKGLGLKTKITTLSVLWGTIGISIVFFIGSLLPSNLVLPIQISMLAVAVVVSVHVLKLPTFKKTDS